MWSADIPEKKKNIVEVFGSNKERGNYVKVEKNCILRKAL